MVIHGIGEGKIVWTWSEIIVMIAWGEEEIYVARDELSL